MGGLVFWLVDGKGLSESGYLSRLILIMEATQFAMGVAAALIWEINPYALVFAISPLYLIHLTLQLPTLQVRAETDAKTGLYNARFFNTALEKELLRADRADYPLSVAMGDLDYLRNINNSHGHLAGDMAIITIANTIKKLVRNYDIVARFGGEEFAILMPETPLKRAAARVEEIRLAIENTVIDLPTTGAYLRVTMSFGIAEREHPGQKPSEVIHNADVALYQAKQSGRNKVCRSNAEDLQQKLVP
jgi:diguanylate cyclase (GGDEF)-like protein